MIFLETKDEIQYYVLEVKELPKIKSLWENSGQYHAKLSKHFSTLFTSLSFEKRMKHFLTMNELYISLAISQSKEIGYCISTCQNGSGEILSFFVEENYRNRGVGSCLIENHLLWLEKNASSISVDVLYENENTIRFYEKCGFKPFTIKMLFTAERKK
ncbi:GNAT family N-acetyltransferase [Fusobacterium necrophorum]|uniref:N-acetyltransferase domain-containing protein n=1 Tax=Fusobacterium necrophorum DJ-2 TaxID=1441737 RepID=A0AB73C6K1_9FUSO|nr:GNAT family N-acetyltransferase [Fusobacterium necrophorum]KDE61221.1 hypothetical protein FUSO4_12245 [Fusobacterium necrophorum DJ-1]KDE73762.1 hypothetical protein FUSO8_00270 [Fusobacterium necrophorum DJ-2]MBR8821855.1 hypothetical protein [Fusobacterium necrophorum]MCF0161912.1 GNAT family N-acetyltransferase [Fusobacterium necrophorum]